VAVSMALPINGRVNQMHVAIAADPALYCVGKSRSELLKYSSAEPLGELRLLQYLRYGKHSGSRTTMITPDALTAYVVRALPDANVAVTDRTGTMDHLSVQVVSDLFKGKNLLDRHRMIYQALDEPMKDGRIHALELKAETSDGC
jgi:stress-induced morphogen